jgi:hypothetical protein
MRFIIALSAAIVSTASVAYAATDRGFDPVAFGHVFEGRSAYENHGSMAGPGWPPLSPIGSNGTTDGSAVPASPLSPIGSNGTTSSDYR